jgi:uncharacterized protein (TIGR02757 family)
MDFETAGKIKFLAKKYETADFLKDDPSQFMHRYKSVRDAETAAFIAANIAFGKRAQILSHTEQILSQAGKFPSEWVQNEGYRNFFRGGNQSFYRMYSHNDFLLFFDALKKILDQTDTIGNFVKKKHAESGNKFLHETICTLFPENCRLIPHTKNSAAKKVNMMLRWLVRTGSPVDLGLWTWYDKKNLIIPLDVHVLQEAAAMKILYPSESGKIPSATIKNALTLTESMREIFPDDPCRADFALFGWGVNKKTGEGYR